MGPVNRLRVESAWMALLQGKKIGPGASRTLAALKMPPFGARGGIFNFLAWGTRGGSDGDNTLFGNRQIMVGRADGFVQPGQLLHV
jgi:hypothetical protein